MKISVVILTYNRSKLLKRCLDSLFVNQSRLPDEIVIVNSSEENVGEVTKEYVKWGIAIKVLKADNVSLADNRNIGVKASSHELVAFTDDDCQVCKGWVESFLRIFDENANLGSVGGRIFDENSQKLAHNIEEVSLMIEDFYNRLNSPFCYYFCTRNVCYNKKVLDKVGLFESTYRKSFEDVIIGLKILIAGYKNIYHPEISVEHCGRSNISGALKRLFMYGRDMYAGTIRFKDIRPRAYVFKAQRSILYIIFSTFVGPINDAFKFRHERNMLAMLCYSFLMKLFVNTGIIYERLIKPCS